MIVTDSKTKELLLRNTVNREIVIHFPDDEIEDITGDRIVSESMTLERSIIEGKELKFGGGIASQFTIKVIGIEIDLTDKNIEVSLRQTVRPLLYPSEELFPSEDLFPCGGTDTYEWRLFTGRIDSALRQKNRAVKEIIAFDDFYNNSKFVYNFMTNFAQYSPNASLGDLREAVENGWDHSDSEDLVLFNDSTLLSLTLENTKKSIRNCKNTVTDVLVAYAELNASFAVMDRFNKLRYVYLLNSNEEVIPYYKDLEWKEYETYPITIMRFTKNGESDSYYSAGYTGLEHIKPCIYVSDNIITKSCSDIENLVLAFRDNVYFEYKYSYRPYKAVLFDYWWLEPGDKVSIDTGAEDTPNINSYVFSVKLTGVQNIRVTINADGKQYLGKDEMNVVQ